MNQIKERWDYQKYLLSERIAKPRALLVGEFFIGPMNESISVQLHFIVQSMGNSIDEDSDLHIRTTESVFDGF